MKYEKLRTNCINKKILDIDASIIAQKYIEIYSDAINNQKIKFMKNIAIIPTIRSPYKNQIEYCFDKIFALLRKVFKKLI